MRSTQRPTGESRNQRDQIKRMVLATANPVADSESADVDCLQRAGGSMNDDCSRAVDGRKASTEVGPKGNDALSSSSRVTTIPQGSAAHSPSCPHSSHAPCWWPVDSSQSQGWGSNPPEHSAGAATSAQHPTRQIVQRDRIMFLSLRSARTRVNSNPRRLPRGYNGIDR